MAHTIEPAASGRAKCRGCGKSIAKGELRFGERLPNPYAEGGDMTLWFHLRCGAYKRPAAMLEILAEHAGELADRAELLAIAEAGVEHERLPRADGAERDPSGRAKCRSCKEAIEKGSWRIRLVWFEEEDGRFQPSGFLHAACAETYLGTADVVDRLVHYRPLPDPDVIELRSALAAGKR